MSYKKSKIGIHFSGIDTHVGLFLEEQSDLTKIFTVAIESAFLEALLYSRTFFSFRVTTSEF